MWEDKFSSTKSSYMDVQAQEQDTDRLQASLNDIFFLQTVLH